MKRDGLVLMSLAIAVTASGCVAGLRDPDPSLSNPDELNGTLDIVNGETTVSADVRNSGYAGDVRFTLIMLDENRTVLGEVDRIMEMRENETRRMSITAEVPENARMYRVEVSNAG